MSLCRGAAEGGPTWGGVSAGGRETRRDYREVIGSEFPGRPGEFARGGDVLAFLTWSLSLSSLLARDVTVTHQQDSSADRRLLRPLRPSKNNRLLALATPQPTSPPRTWPTHATPSPSSSTTPDPLLAPPARQVRHIRSTFTVTLQKSHPNGTPLSSLPFLPSSAVQTFKTASMTGAKGVMHACRSPTALPSSGVAERCTPMPASLPP